MTNVPDLLEQMTWAINEGGPFVGGKQEVYEFLANVGRVINITPSRTAASKPPVKPYAPDLLPLIQQMAWSANEKPMPASIETFLATITWYLTGKTPNLNNTGPFFKPTGPPLPPALQSLPLNEIPFVYQVAYWLINEGAAGNQQARAFLEALGHYLFFPNPRTAVGPFRYPTK